MRETARARAEMEVAAAPACVRIKDASLQLAVGPRVASARCGKDCPLFLSQRMRRMLASILNVPMSEPVCSSVFSFVLCQHQRLDGVMQHFLQAGEKEFDSSAVEESAIMPKSSSGIWAVPRRASPKSLQR